METTQIVNELIAQRDRYNNVIAILTNGQSTTKRRGRPLGSKNIQTQAAEATPELHVIRPEPVEATAVVTAASPEPARKQKVPWTKARRKAQSVRMRERYAAMAAANA